MGGGFSFVVKGLDGAFQGVSGKVVGSSGETDVEIEVSGEEAGLPAGIYVVDSTKGTAVRAILSDEAFEDAPEVDLDNASRTHEGSFIDANAVTLLDVPSGWALLTSDSSKPPMPKRVFKSDDGYFVEEVYKTDPGPFGDEKFVVYRSELYGDQEDYYSWYKGDVVGRVNSWAEIQALVNGDSDDYQKEIEKAQDFKVNPQKYLEPIRPVKVKTEQSSIEEKIAIAEAANSAVTQEHIDSLQKALTSLFSRIGVDTTYDEEQEIAGVAAAAFDGVVLKDKNGKEVRLEISYKSASTQKMHYHEDEWAAKISFGGHYVDVETNEVIGNFGRTINILTDGTISVDNGSMKINSEHQSRGIGSAMNARNEVLYSHTGISKVNVDGASSRAQKPGEINYIGATHWARNGFDWASSGERMSTLRGVEAAVMAWNRGERTDREGNPLFDSDSQVDDVINLVTRAMGEDFDDENRVTAGELVRWPGADAWFADHGYDEAEWYEQNDEGSTIKFSKDITPAEGSTFKLEKSPEPEPEAEPEPEPETPAPAEAETGAPSVEETAAQVDNIVYNLNQSMAYPSDISNWTKVGAQAGSNPGGIYEDSSGRRYYVKTAKSRQHAENEILASALYRALGVDAVEVLLAKDSSDPNNPLRTISPIIDAGDDGLSSHLRDEEYLDKIRENFMVDAWLANWDVAGLSFDNIITNSNGDPVRVDPGGALLYRAQGEPKGDLFRSEMNEHVTLRNRSVNAQSSLIFMDTTREQKKSGASRVLSLSPKQIDTMVDTVVSDSVVAQALKTKLKSRRIQMMQMGLDLFDPFAPMPKAPDRSEAQDRVEREGVKLESDVARFSPQNQLIVPVMRQLDHETARVRINADGGLYLDVNFGGEDTTVNLTINEVKNSLKDYLANDVESRRRDVGARDATEYAAKAVWLVLNGQFEESSAFLQSVIADYDAALLENKSDLVQMERDNLVKLFNGLKNDGKIDENIIPSTNAAAGSVYYDYSSDFGEYINYGEPPEWFDGKAADLFKEVYGSSVETNLGKLEKISRDDADAMGVSPFYDATPLELDQTDFENVPSIREAISNVATTNRSKEDSLMDGGDIEDGRVTFSKTMQIEDIDSMDYVNPDNPDLEKQLTASFKLTSWAGKRLRNTAETSYSKDPDGLWTRSDVVGVRRRKLGKKGFQYYDKKGVETSLTNTGDHFTYRDPQGRFTISFNSPSTMAQSLQNTVEITFSTLEPSDQDIKDAFKAAGVKDPRPARVEDVRIIAENRLISVLGNSTKQAMKNENLVKPSFNPSKLERADLLDEIKSMWEVTADDLEISTGDNGLLEMKFPRRVAEDLAQSTGVEAFSHSFTIKSSWASGDPPTKVREDVADKIINVLLGSEDGSVVSGLQSTIERFSSGVQVEGMSSSKDVRTGGADYVYLTPGTYESLAAANPHKGGWGSETVVIAEFDAPDLLTRADFWANHSDAFGERINDDPVDSLTPGSYEYMIKRHIPAGVISRMYVHSNVKEEVIARLKKFNITSMYGIPLDQFFVASNPTTEVTGL